MKKEKDTMRAVNAVREKIKGKYFSDKLQVGYETPKVQREIGDKWTDDDGVVWVQHDGYYANESRLKDLKCPLFCPKCKKVMGGAEAKFNTGCWSLYGHCFDCHLKEKKKLQLAGNWELYEKKQNLQYNLDRMKDVKIDFLENKEKMMSKRVIENYDMKGHVLTPEVFDGLPKEKVNEIEKDINEYIGRLKKDLKKTIREMKKNDKKMGN